MARVVRSPTHTINIDVPEVEGGALPTDAMNHGTIHLSERHTSVETVSLFSFAPATFRFPWAAFLACSSVLQKDFQKDDSFRCSFVFKEPMFRCLLHTFDLMFFCHLCTSCVICNYFPSDEKQTSPTASYSVDVYFSSYVLLLNLANSKWSEGVVCYNIGHENKQYMKC